MRGALLLVSCAVFLFGCVESTELECRSENETLECVTECPPERTCKNRDIKFFCVDKKTCQQKCVCKEGFLRNHLRECIAEEHCVESCTQPNEELTCKTSCPPELCFSIVARFKCDSKETCKTACFCKPGFLRQKEGSPCIPTKDCPELANSPDFH